MAKNAGMSGLGRLEVVAAVAILSLAWAGVGWVSQAREDGDLRGILGASQELWTNETFWVPPGRGGSLYQTEAMLVNISSSILWYVETRLIDSRTNYTAEEMTNISITFEDTILPRLHAAFGFEPLPPGDIDGDPRSTILITTSVSLFARKDQLSKSQEFYSNERDMIYVHKQEDIAALLGTAAHEFTHLIQWNYDREERGWVNEGLAQEALYVVGYGDSTADDYLQDTTVGLFSWTFRGRASYGAWELFIHYLSERFGGWSFTRALTQNPQHGMEGIESTLEALGYQRGFGTLFRNWGIANHLDDPTLADGEYGYSNITATARITSTLPGDGIAVDVSVDNGGIAYLSISTEAPSIQITLEVNGLTGPLPSDFLVGVLIVRQNDTVRLADLERKTSGLIMDAAAIGEASEATLMLGYANRSVDLSDTRSIVFRLEEETAPPEPLDRDDRFLYVILGISGAAIAVGVVLVRISSRGTKANSSKPTTGAPIRPDRKR